MYFLLIGFEKAIANSIGLRSLPAFTDASGVINRSTSKHPDQVLAHALFFRQFFSSETDCIGDYGTHLRCEDSDVRKNERNEVGSVLVMSSGGKSSTSGAHLV